MKKLLPSVARLAGTVAAVNACAFTMMSSIAATSAAVSSAAWLLSANRPFPFAAVFASSELTGPKVSKPIV